MMHYWDWEDRWGMGWGMGPMGWLLMLLFWVAVIGLAVWLVVLLSRRQGRSDQSRSGSSVALDILKERYARGEIGQEEFEQKKRDLL
ncbi:SHOCT domain-containing protein [Thermithiobacillus tepidarius DSM 3134]|uniref:SHOCT domain-containing protein n=1 Tax=Thermithiobacillus tepidarius TaxID=929 RepID=UPI00041CC5C3|nr:SHOCT domain-containing protein [Thermithiobacillus tepidarius]